MKKEYKRMEGYKIVPMVAAGIMALGLGVLVQGVPSNVSAETSGSTTFNVEVPLTLAITSHTPVVNIDASTAGTFYTGSATVTSTTNNPTGYRLDMEDKDADTSMENTSDTSAAAGTGFETSIGSITSNVVIDGTGSNFPVNKWGYAKEDTTTTYRPIPVNGSAASVKTTSAPADVSNATVTFGTKINKDLVGGTYTDTVVFSLTANAVERADITKLTSMQDLANHPTYCTNSLTGTTATLVDERDPSGKQYKVKKLADGNCWMVDNMKIANLTIEPTKSNVPTGTSFVLPTTFAGSTSVAGPTWGNQEKTAKVIDATGAVASNGYLYNWYAATAGAVDENGTDLMTAAYGEAVGDICPKGWRLPGGGTEDKTFYNLYNIEYPTASGQHPYQSTANMQRSDGIYPGFVFTGYYNYGSGLVSNTGSGYYWSRTVYSANNSYSLYLNSSSVYPQDYNDKGYGFAVRCVSAY